jgi:histidinol-phosphate aminotransferase
MVARFSVPPAMSQRPVPQPGILDIAPYVPGKSGAPGARNVTKLSSNESPLGASPKAVAAYKTIADKLEVYPEGSSRVVREALGAVHGIDPDRIVCGDGSDDLLHLLAQCYLGAGDAAVMSKYGFSVYPIVTRGADAEVIVADETDYCADVGSLLAAVTERTKVLFLANPNNPTGTYLSERELMRLHARLRPDILFVLDSAYADYVTASDYAAGLELVEGAENVVMVRTFSKIGLAAVRLGWMYGPAHVVDAVNRIRGPFNVSLPAQVMGVATAEDGAFIARLKAHNAAWREWLTKTLSSNRLRVVPSQANFILVLFPDAAAAAEAFTALMAKGLIVREVGVYGIANGLRITIGSEAAMRAVAEVLKPFGAKEA